MTEHILSMLGLALKAGRVEVGEEPVGAAARAKKARVIFVAQDAAPSSVRRAQSFAHTGSTLCVTLPNRVRPSALRELVPMTSMDASLPASIRAREGEESSTVRPVTCSAGYSKASRPSWRSSSI